MICEKALGTEGKRKILNAVLILGMVFTAVFTLYRGESILTWKLSLLIQNDDGSCYVVPMAVQERKDVTEAMNDGFNYNTSGFSVTVNKNYIKSDHAHYYILYENNDRDMIVDLDEAIREEAQ